MSSPNYETMDEVKSRFMNIFLANKRFLANTDVDSAIQNFYTINNATISNVNDLRISLNRFKDNLNDNYQRELFNSVNNLLLPIENEYFFERLGYGTLTSNARQESFDGGLTYVTTVTSLIGSNAINAVSKFDDDTITGVIGNEELLPTTLLNVTSASPTSLSDGYNKLSEAVSTAIGISALNIAKGITLNQCTLDPNTLGAEIYSLPLSPNLVSAWNAVAACSNWHITSETYGYGITNTGSAADCYVLPTEKAFSGCIYYLLA